MAYNISETSGSSVGTGASGLDGWTFTADLSDPGVTVVTGDFDEVTLSGQNQGEAADGYVFSALNTNDFGTLSYNTSDGTFTFTIDRSAVLASGSDQSVTFTVIGSDGGSSDDDTVTINLVICVARGTRVRTDRGRVPVETLGIGDKVWTFDSGFQEIRWIGSRRVDAADLRSDRSLRPIRIDPGALGDNRPRRPLRVSPQHRVLLRDWRAPVYFGHSEVLVPAKGLVNGSTIRVDHQAQEVEYFHLLFDTHQIIETDGALTESFHPGPHSIDGIDDAARDELFRLFPELETDPAAFGPSARMSLKGFEAKMFAALDPVLEPVP